MSPTGSGKGTSDVRDRKIQKLTRMIKAKERELDLVERKMERAKSQVSDGDMSKGDYRRLHIQLSRDRKAVRGAITRLERSRLNRERRLKDKASEKEEKTRERQERREARAMERELRREERATKKGKKGDDEDDGDED
jgi:hypothetical protein